MPRISISIEDDENGSQGFLRILSVGFGIHQAWMLLSMYSGMPLFSDQALPSLPESPPGTISYVFLVWVSAFVLTLLVAAITDQKYLRFYTAKRVLTASALTTALGTALMFGCLMPGTGGAVATASAGILTGVGSALLTLFWATAFSRCDSTTIVVNSAVGVVVSVAVYMAVAHVVPVPFAGVVTACLPLLELPILWTLTPVSYAVRHAVPIFNPLPVRKVPFCIRFGAPIVLFGFAVGAMRTISTQIIVPSSDMTTLLLSLFVGGAVTVVVLVGAFSLDKRSHWDLLFRPLIPFIVVTLFFIPALLDGSPLAAIVLLVGYLCLEALIWIFFGLVCQEFRPSPVFTFGFGCACMAAGAVAGQFGMIHFHVLDSLVPFGDMGGVAVLMFILMLAYALMPRVRDIKRVIAPHNHDMANAVAGFNRRAEEMAGSAGPATPTAAQQAPEGREASEAERGEGGGSPAAADSAAEEQRAQRSGRFRMQCESIADRYLLSRRETEVMFLLAKGHNAAYIQDKLCISKSTAKTHISHIYRKLDIHNQQELLAMVDEARDEIQLP